MREVELRRRPPGALSSGLPAQQAARLEASLTQATEALSGRTSWHVSSTETGGGVAEMLHNLLGYLLDAGVRTRWLVIDADEQFFTSTKHLHNAIHGIPAQFTPDAREHYEQVLARNLPLLRDQLVPGDIVMLHDPQSAGLVPALSQAGARVAWRSHIGRDTPNDASVAGWDFLRRYIEQADALVFSRPHYAPAWVQPDKLWVIPPSIDPLSAKNRPMSPADCLRVLTEAGLPTDRRLVVQVSRWDRLKDMPGVMEGFRQADPDESVHLVLAGPAVAGVTDDPEGAEVFAECQVARARLPEAVRARVHLASIPMDDVERNAAIVNALQRQATVIVQKSLAEGFGLTVAEAMWKAKPVIASAVGGIKDQIRNERSGLLLSDPADPGQFATALRRLLSDEALAARLGRAAHARVLDYYLDDRQLTQTSALFESLAAAAPVPAPRAPSDLTALERTAPPAP
jgi:trehalose synthase